MTATPAASRASSEGLAPPAELDPDFRRLRWVSRALRLGRPSEAVPFVRELLAAAAPEAIHLLSVERRYTAANQDQALLELLLEEPAATFATFGGAALCLRIAHRLGQAAPAEAALANHIEGGELAAFGVLDYLIGLRELRPESVSLAARLKFGGLPGGPEGNLLDCARALARRLEVTPALVQFLHERRADPSPGFEAWLEELKFGLAVDHLMREGSLAEPVVQLGAALFDPLSDYSEEELLAIARPVFGEPPWRGPRLLALAHCGPLMWTNHFLKRLFPEGRRLGIGHIMGALRVDEYPGAGLFGALRTLDAGGTLQMAPDGGFGRARTAVNVLGCPTTIGDGAAFLCFETGCPNAFCAAELRDGRFVPTFVTGPQPGPGESYESFRVRWAQFYAEQLTDLFARAPSRMAIDGRWYATLRQGWLTPAAPGPASLKAPGAP